MKIRLHGTDAECRAAAGAIASVLDVVAASDPYPDRGRSRLVRVYLDARLPTALRKSPAPGRSLLPDNPTVPDATTNRTSR
ncbi:hypothetical protein FDG2_1905 [Candidatus Protofrankia californiensis]|uniref:Uncharacterized protein n=1 Tax=Candidatus Protofrankia californiensis TaxID=1839754 RepID=A0A1C3NWN8_9ACTN|nr:hypothetical protein FDG2_1905 [Candidatus Protofrankia californiensis]